MPSESSKPAGKPSDSIPTEFGPFFIFNPAARITRTHTLFVKWAIMCMVGVVCSALYVWISMLVGMPIDKPLALFLFGAFAIAVVGITSASILAAFGTSGIIIGLVLFIVLGVPSSGGTVPLEAQPKIFHWLANFVPLHQVFLGVRAILYFRADYDSGLLHAFWMTVFGLVVGVVLGLGATRLYESVGMSRDQEYVAWRVAPGGQDRSRPGHNRDHES